MTKTQESVAAWQARQPAFTGPHITKLDTSKAQRQAQKRQLVKNAGGR